MILLVVFVPAFSMIFSPPAYTPCPSSECPPCSCPPCECPELQRVVGKFVLFGGVYPEEGWTAFIFYLDLTKYQGYKYIIVVPFPRDIVLYGEIYNWDNPDEYWWLEPEVLDNQRTYFEIKESVRMEFWYYISDTNPNLWYIGRFIEVYLIREDLDPRSVLNGV